MQKLLVWLSLSAFLSVTLAGCVGDDGGDDDPAALGYTPIDLFDRRDAPYNFSGSFATTLVPGPYEQLPVEEADVMVELPMEEGGAALSGNARIHLAVWRPDVPEGMTVPVIADVGPYYQSAEGAARPSYMRLWNESLLPWGYAIAQVSVFGTGHSNHCMDLMGNAEQLGIDAAVTWLGTQEWSNGNVALTGASYDGSTPWEAATFGNPHLKTIMPVSGLIGMHELMWRNGSAEFRGPIMHNGVYGFFGFDSVSMGLGGIPSVNDPDPEDVQNLCPDYLRGPTQGAGALLTGDHGPPAYDEYWQERYFLDKVLENYQGSVLLVQGLQDWNVDNHMAFPTHRLLEEAGIEVKGLYGQWEHMFPDTPGSHAGMGASEGGSAFPNTVRFDHKQDMLEWFDYYLKGIGEKPDLWVEVQDTTGQWRIEESYPPRDAQWARIDLASMQAIQGNGVLHAETRAGDNMALEYLIPAADVDRRIAGLPTLHVLVTPSGAGGQLFAQLNDATTGHRLGHAVMDLRFHDGGRDGQPVTPGQQITAKMQFWAMDTVVPAGHDLILTIAGSGFDYQSSPVTNPVLVHDEGSILSLPLVERGPETMFDPPEWWDILPLPDGVETEASYDGDLLPCQPDKLPCQSFEDGPDAEPVDGVWFPVDPASRGFAFTTAASNGGAPVSDTDCYYVADVDGEPTVIGGANKGSSACGGNMHCDADWLFLYAYSGPVDHLEMTYQDEVMVRKGAGAPCEE